MNGGISDTNTTSPLNTLLTSADMGNADLQGGTAGGAAGGATGGPGPGQNGYLWSDGTFHATPEPSAGGGTTGGAAGGGAKDNERTRYTDVVEEVPNEDARKRGEMLSAFLASFQAAYRRNNPNFNFTRNPRLAKSLGLPFSGDIGR